MRTLPIVVAALALAGCGDPLFFAELEEKEICYTQSTGTVPGLPAVLGPGTVHVPPGSVDISSGIPGLDGDGTSGTLKMTSFTLTTTDVDLSGISSASITLTHDSDAPVLISYERPADGAAADPSRLVATFTSPELLDWIASGGTIAYDVTLSGTPPNDDWSATLETCFSARVMVDIMKAGKN